MRCHCCSCHILLCVYLCVCMCIYVCVCARVCSCMCAYERVQRCMCVLCSLWCMFVCASVPTWVLSLPSFSSDAHADKMMNSTQSLGMEQLIKKENRWVLFCGFMTLTVALARMCKREWNEWGVSFGGCCVVFPPSRESLVCSDFFGPLNRRHSTIASGMERMHACVSVCVFVTFRLVS
mgnify:CR=1 FL=1